MTAEPQTEERAHAELGASSCERWWNCPASIRLSRGLPNESGQDAARGTVEHKIAELCLENRQDAIEYTSKTFREAGFVFEVDGEMADRVQTFVDDVRVLVPDTILPSDLHTEVRFDLAPLGAPAPMFGTADAVAYVPVWRKLYVKDYKSGWVFVDVNDNKQLRYYALGAMLWLGPDKPVSEIEVTIVQPRHAADPVRRETFDATDLAEWSMELMDRAKATLDPHAPAKAGKWCKFCPARGQCATRARAALDDVRLDFDGVAVDATPPALPDPRLLTAEERSAVNLRAKEIRDFLDAVAVFSRAEAIRGIDQPGWKLIDTQGDAEWINAEEAAAYLEDVAELDPYAPRKVLSYAQVRDKLIAKRREELGGKRGSKKQAEADVKAWLVDLIHRPKTGVALVPESHSTPARQAAGAEFLALASTEPKDS